MAASTKSKVTTDHEEIRRWALARSGKPGAPIHLKSEDNGNGLIRIYFPEDHSKNSLAEISWEDWFKKFDAAKLAFLYQELTPGGQKSNFNQVVSRKAVDEVESAVGGKGRSASRRSSRRSPEIPATSTLSDGEPQTGAVRGPSSKKAGKKSIAALASVASPERYSRRAGKLRGTKADRSQSGAPD
jgi:hypothetical protein